MDTPTFDFSKTTPIVEDKPERTLSIYQQSKPSKRFKSSDSTDTNIDELYDLMKDLSLRSKTSC